jgi:protease-4
MENQNLTSGDGAWERAAIEKLLLADLRERRAARRWRIVKSLLWLILIGAIFFWMLLADDWPSRKPAGPHTAMVSIKGEIGDDTNASADKVLPAIRDALEDDNTKALVLLINSPGGSPVQAGLINDEIFRLKKLHKKPIYAVVEESCASAAYYIASAADKIYVDKASIVGSIGVLMDGFGFTGAMEKLGVERRLLTSGQNKGMLDPFSPMTDTQRQYAQTLLDQIHQQFIDKVKKGRGNRLKESPELFSGLFWTGAQAIDLGLADDLGSLDSVARDVIKAKEVVDYTNRDNLAERMARRFGAALGQEAITMLLKVRGIR